MTEKNSKAFSNIDESKVSSGNFTWDDLLEHAKKVADHNDKEKKLRLDFDTSNNKFRSEYLKREKELEAAFAQKEKQLLERENAFIIERESFQTRAKTFEENYKAQSKRVSDELVNLENLKNENNKKLSETITNLETERKNDNNRLEESIKKVEAESAQSKKELNEKIARSSQTFITEALFELRAKESKYQKLSISCNYIGGSAIAFGLIYFICLTYSTTNLLLVKELNWELITFLSLKGLITISLLVGFSRYAYVLSNTYLKEALKIADRMHAISFGKFYLDSYGSTHDWEQVKEVFENWNINNSAPPQSSKADDVDLVSIDKATTIIERIVKLIPSISSATDKK